MDKTEVILTENIDDLIYDPGLRRSKRQTAGTPLMRLGYETAFLVRSPC